MLDPHWVFVAAALGLAGSLRYAAATLTGAARPNLVTWILYMLALCLLLVGVIAARHGRA